MLGCDIQPVIITEGDLNKAIGQYYQIQSTMEEVYKDFNLEIQDEKEEEISAHELRAMVEDAPIVRLVNIIISQAVRTGPVISMWNPPRKRWWSVTGSTAICAK